VGDARGGHDGAAGSSGGAGDGNDGGGGDEGGREPPEEPERAPEWRPSPLLVAIAASACVTAVAVRASDSAPVALSSAATDVVAAALVAPVASAAARARRAAGWLAYSVSPGHLADVFFGSVRPGRAYCMHTQFADVACAMRPQEEETQQAERTPAAESKTKASAVRLPRNPLAYRWPSAEELPWSEEALAAAAAEAEAEAAAQAALAELPLPPPALNGSDESEQLASPPQQRPRRPSLVCTLAALVSSAEYTLPALPLPPLPTVDVKALRRRTDRAVTATAKHVRSTTKVRRCCFC
jgi:hypothetical protein